LQWPWLKAFNMVKQIRIMDIHSVSLGQFFEVPGTACHAQ
jgi:hypothetical protein